MLETFLYKVGGRLDLNEHQCSWLPNRRKITVLEMMVMTAWIQSMWWCWVLNWLCTCALNQLEPSWCREPRLQGALIFVVSERCSRNPNALGASAPGFSVPGSSAPVLQCSRLKHGISLFTGYTYILSTITSTHKTQMYWTVTFKYSGISVPFQYARYLSTESIHILT